MINPRILLCCAVCLLATAIHSQNKTPEGYSLFFSDDFNTGTLDTDGITLRPDTSVWEFEQAFVRGQQMQYYTDRRENVFLKDGMLYIRALADTTLNPVYNPTSDDPRYNSKYVATSGSIFTKDKYRVHGGIMETRAKIPAYEGFAPAIWHSGNPDYGYSEIDAMEWIDKRQCATVHWGVDWRNIVNRTAQLQDASLPAGFWDDFHTWRTEWNDLYIRVYIDDFLLFELPLDKTFVAERGYSPFVNPDNRMNTKLNLAFWVETPVKTFPADFIVDYTRIYTADRPSSPLIHRISQAKELLEHSSGHSNKSRRALQKAIKTATKSASKTNVAAVNKALSALDNAITTYLKSGSSRNSDSWEVHRYGI